MKEVIKSNFEVTPEVEKNLVDIAQRYSYQVDGEIGLLYHKLKTWYEKYENYPTKSSINTIIKFLNVDLLRTKTKTRVKDGVLSGVGAGVSFASLDAPISEDEENASLSDFISDAGSLLPNDIERFDINELFDSAEVTQREKEILYDFIDGMNLSEIGGKYGFTESRACQIRAELYNRLRKSYTDLASPVLKYTPPVKKPKLNEYVDHLIDKKDKVEKYRKKVIRNKKKTIPLFKESKTHTQASVEVVLQIIEEYKRSLLDLEQLCQKHSVSYGSFRQKVSKLGLPIRSIKRDKFYKSIHHLFTEWNILKDDMSLNEFCRQRNVEHFNFRNWIKNRKDAESRWHCIKARQNREHIVAKCLTKNLVIETFAPQIKVSRATVRGRRTRTEPMFVNYVFARFHLEDYRQIAYFPGVTNMVRFSEEIPTIPDFVIDKLRKGVHTVANDKGTFEEGDLVEILEGSFKGYCAKIYRPDLSVNRVSLLLEMLGKSVEMEIHKTSIEKVK